MAYAETFRAVSCGSVQVLPALQIGGPSSAAAAEGKHGSIYERTYLKQQWTMFQKSSGELVVTQALHSAVAMALGKRFAELMRLVALYSSKAAAPAGGASSGHNATASSAKPTLPMMRALSAQQAAGAHGSAPAPREYSEAAGAQGSTAAAQQAEGVLQARQQLGFQQKPAPSKHSHRSQQNVAQMFAKASERAAPAAAVPKENAGPVSVDLTV